MIRSRGNRSLRVIAAVVGLLAALGIVTVANLTIAPRAPRLDVTATGRLQLAPRTLAALRRAPEGTRIVLAADLSSGRRSPAATRRVLDMLDEIDRAAPSVSVTRIDTADPEGLREFEAFVASLLDRDRDAIDAMTGRVLAVAERLDEAGRRLESLGHAVDDLRGLAASSAADALAPRASQLRATAEQVPPMLDAVRELLERRLAERDAPDLLAARSLLVDSAGPIRTLLRVIGDDLTARLSAGQFGEEGAVRAASLVDRMTDLVDSLGAEVAGLESSSMPPVIRAVAALESAEALLVLGPPGGAASAVSIDELIPQPLPGAPAVDAGRTAESLVANALSLLDATARPVVVITHASPRRIVRGGGEGPLTNLHRRSATRGIEWLEWPVLLEQDPPAGIAAALADGRPVVYAVIGVDTAGSGGLERADRTAKVLSSLLDAGELTMINLAPSTLPGVGEPDPMHDAVAKLGLRADTGRPILRGRPRGQDRLVDWEATLVPDDADHPLPAVLARLATTIPWPLLIEQEASETGEAPESVSHTPILSVAGLTDAWREGEWLGYWVTPPQQRPLLRDKPTPGGTRDADLGEGSIAWAVERAQGSRAVVIGSHLWLFDQSVDRPAVIDGRVVQTSPGNAELFFASIEWLTGNETMLAPSAEALTTPTVQPIDSGRLSALRWGLMAGLPLCVLALGVAMRVVRG
ncbi:MAG: hypothetical protein ACTS22_02990 [Phycisphaerales bacterium]